MTSRMKCCAVRMNAGFNYFDSAPTYCHSNSEFAVGRALKDVRDKVLISTKISMDDVHSSDDYRRCLEISLKKLDTDYIDFYHFWALNRDTYDNVVLRYHLLEEARKAKEEGLIRHISFSFHDRPEVSGISSTHPRSMAFPWRVCWYSTMCWTG